MGGLKAFHPTPTPSVAPTSSIARSGAASDPSHHRQLHAVRTDAEIQSEHVELEAIDGANGQTEHAAERQLETAAARRSADDGAAEVVLADRRGGKIDFQLRHRPRDPGGEGVGVGTRPRPVFGAIGIAASRLVDALDQLVDPRSTSVRIKLGHRAEPAPVRWPVCTTMALSDHRSCHPTTS